MESIEKMLQRFSAKLDAELQEIDMETGLTLEELQRQNFYFSETYVKLCRENETDTAIFRPVEPRKSMVPVEPRKSMVLVEPRKSKMLGRWLKPAVASRTRVMGR